MPNATDPNARVNCQFCGVSHRLDELRAARCEPWPGLPGVEIRGECPRQVAPGEMRGTLCVDAGDAS
jgi:hypothetical protein